MGLDLLNFTPDATTRETLAKRAPRQMLRYFGLGGHIAAADRDEQDDLQSHCLNVPPPTAAT